MLIIGTSDRTIVGKGRLTKELIAEHGQYQKLGKQVHQQIKGSILVELPGVGHIAYSGIRFVQEKYCWVFEITE